MQAIYLLFAGFVPKFHCKRIPPRKQVILIFLSVALRDTGYLFEHLWIQVPLTVDGLPFGVLSIHIYNQNFSVHVILALHKGLRVDLSKYECVVIFEISCILTS